MEILNKLKNLDAYPKINEDFYSRTFSGGVITVVSSIIILLLFISETRLFLYSATETKLIVDTSRGERLHVNVSIEPTLQLIGGTLLFFDITFPSLPCTLLSVDTVDISGEQHYDITVNLVLHRLIGLYKSMGEGLIIVKLTVVLVMVQKL
ncbi:hypothetical protein GW17_00046639 [Ensete ventricosum]|nr:hypothetical protein GW17_00046639 [Ensete ventricosum]